MKKELVNVQDVRKVIDHIKSIKSDDELAHKFEDDLYLVLLKAIANNACNNPSACAKEALKTQLIDFARWKA